MAIPWSRLTLNDLRAIATKASIPGRAGMRRKELLRAVRTKARHDSVVREMVHTKIGARVIPGKPRSSAGTTPGDGDAIPPSSSPPPVESAAPVPAAPFVDRGKVIPDTYGDDLLRFMVRDPWSGFLYWELAGTLMDRLRLAYGSGFLQEAQWQVRILSLLDRVSCVVPIDVRACRAYVGLHPGAVYTAALGFMDPESAFVEVLRAGPVYSPRAAVSPVVDEEWEVKAEDLAAMVGGPVLSMRGGASPSSIWQVRFGRRVEGSGRGSRP